MATEGRRRAAVGIALGLLVSSLSAATLTADAAERTRPVADRAWSGFRINSTGRAAGSWIGARKVGRNPGRVVYRIDPRAQSRSDGFRKARQMAKVPGPGPKYAAGPRSTARAAWILSKYGTFPNEFQSAAVDAAVLHLLARHRFRLPRRKAKARLRQSGQPAAIRRLAKTMLSTSAVRAGPYRLTAQQVGDSAIGDRVRVDLRATVARSGAPLTSVPVWVRISGGRWHSAGETNAAGWATFGYVDPAAGPKQVQVRVGRVPETRLLVLPPKRSKASRVAVAGRKRALDGLTVVYVKARPRARVTSQLTRAGRLTSASLRISNAYGASARPAAAVLHGPFGSFSQAACDRKVIRRRTITVTGSGAYKLPALRLNRPGIYKWRIEVAGNSVNLPARACDGPFRVASD